jgi:hypothetical protein
VRPLALLADPIFRAVEREFYAYSRNLHHLETLEDRRRARERGRAEVVRGMIARVFPRRTKATPQDDYTFTDEPGLFVPEDITEQDFRRVHAVIREARAK